jgi:acetylornithine deacetylase
MLQWRLTAHGRNFHSGMPHKTVNAVELAMDVLQSVQTVFYRDIAPPHPLQKDYAFACSSSLKPTVMPAVEGALNAIKGKCVLEGDIRLVPFYKVKDVRAKIDAHIATLKQNKFKDIEGRRGPDAHCTDGCNPAVLAPSGVSDLSRCPRPLRGWRADNVPDAKADIEWEWTFGGTDGLACDLTSRGFAVLCKHTARVVGACKPVSDTGTLPLVADLRAAGYDLQVSA